MRVERSEIRERIKKAIVACLELEIEPAAIGDDTGLFAPQEAGGLDSLAAIEVVVALSNEFGISLDEVPRESVRTVTTLAEFIAARLDVESPS
jgi:acyl carrier protein